MYFCGPYYGTFSSIEYSNGRSNNFLPFTFIRSKPTSHYQGLSVKVKGKQWEFRHLFILKRKEYQFSILKFSCKILTLYTCKITGPFFLIYKYLNIKSIVNIIFCLLVHHSKVSTVILLQHTNAFSSLEG